MLRSFFFNLGSLFEIFEGNLPLNPDTHYHELYPDLGEHGFVETRLIEVMLISLVKYTL